MDIPEPLMPEPRVKVPRGPMKNGERHRNSPYEAGRPPYAPTKEHRNLVTTLRGAGVPIETIAALLGIAKSTAEKHFRYELTMGRELVVARVSARAVQKALAGDNTMMQFYLARFGGEQWKDRRQLEHTGPNGDALSPPNLILTVLQAEPDEQSGPAA